MLQSFGAVFGKKKPQKGGPLIPESYSLGSPLQRATGDKKQVYSKVFRWRLPDGKTEEPASVEIVGSFTEWQKVPLVRDSILDAWHVTLHHIQGNRTHHYMLLVDGQPTYDKTCDGLAAPHGNLEERFGLQTDRGPRVFMLFAQAK